MHAPNRHIVMSFVSADDATVAVLLLYQLGLASADVASYTPAQMRARASIVLARAGAPTPPGLLSDRVIAQRELARCGHSFVLVRARSAPQLKRIGRIAAEAHAYRAPPLPERAAPRRPMTAMAGLVADAAPPGPRRATAIPATLP